MNYELAKQLKDAGFPQPELTDASFNREYNEKRFLLRQNCDSRDGEYDNFNDRTMWVQYFSKNYVNEMREFVVYIPTLLELIEACGHGLWSLVNATEIWVAKNDELKLAIDGKTPEESVARLWLKLNEKV